MSDGRILIARGNGQFSWSTDGGLTWSKPFEARDAAGALLTGEGGDRNLIRLAGNGVGYVDRQGPYPDQYLLFWRSEDGGKTWEKPIRLTPPSLHGIAALNDAIIRTASGRIVLPVYGFMEQGRDLHKRNRAACCLGLRGNEIVGTSAHHGDPTFCWCFVMYSDDDGRSWKRSRSGEIYVFDPETMNWHMAGEPTVVEVEPRKLLMFMRTNLGRLYKSWSFDDGETWSAAMPTQLAASGAPAQLRKIPGTGDLLVVWTQQGEEEIRKGFIRTRLSTAVSRTNGGVWEYFQNIESVLEGTRIEPGPIRYIRPEGVVAWGPTYPDPVRDPKYYVDIPETYARTSYPSVFFHKDRVLIGNTNAHYKKDGEYVMPGRLRVVPISWLYGGAQHMKPSPELKKQYPIAEH